MELVFLMLILFIIMLVGHAMWVVLAWILRGGRPREGGSYEPTVADDRAATARHLEYLRRECYISSDLHKEMLDAIAEESRMRTEARVWRPEPVADASSAVARNAADSVEPIESAEPEQPRSHRPRETAEPLEAERPEPVAATESWTSIAEAIHATPPAEPAPAPEPRRPFSEVLMSFMAEKNIRWGELLGGLLILCCSTALVISLWSQIESIPVLKFLIFTSITAAMFGVGLFVHHRWKLPTTGHALLIVSSLLVPLNLLAFAAFTQRAAATSPWTLGLELGSVALFGWLLLLAGRILVPTTPRLFALGIIGLSVFSLLARHARLAGPEGSIWFCFAPVGLYAAIMALSVRWESKRSRLSEPQARRLFLQLGAQTLACAAPLGLAFIGWGPRSLAMHLFSPILGALAVPALATGLFIYRRAGRNVAPQTPTVAMSISLVSAGVMLIALALAWPLPSRLMPVLLINAAAMLAVSRAVRHPAIHAAISLWLSAAWILLFHLFTGHIQWADHTPRELLDAIVSASTGHALVAPVLICLLLAEWLQRTRARAVASGYTATGLSLAAVSVLAVTAFEFAVPGDKYHVVGVYLVYAIASFVLAWRMNLAFATVAGCLLAQMALLQATVYIWHLAPFPWATSLLIGASLCTLLNLGPKVRSASDRVSSIYAVPFGRLAVVFSLFALAGIALTASGALLGSLSVRMFWCAALWTILAAANGWPVVFNGAQLAALAGILAAVQIRLAHADWYDSLASAIRDPWLWQAHLLAAAGLCLIIALARLLVARQSASASDPFVEPQPKTKTLRSIARTLLVPTFPSVDQLLSAVLVLAVVLLAARAVYPAVAIEHGQPALTSGLDIARHATGPGSWAVIGALSAVLLAHAIAGYLRSALLGILILLACSSALIAARFEPPHGVIVSWRFLLAGLFLLTSGLLWAAPKWTRRLAPLGIGGQHTPLNPQAVQLWLGTLFALPLIVLTVTHTTALSFSATVSPWAASEGSLRILLLGPSVLLAFTLLGHGLSERLPSYAVAAAVLASVAIAGTEVALTGRARRSLAPEFVVWLLQLVTIVAAGTALVWHVLRTWLTAPATLPKFPNAALLLPRAVMLLLYAGLIAFTFVNPRFIHPAAHAAGSLWGLLAILSLETALFMAHDADRRLTAVSRNAIWLFLAVPLIAFAAARFDARNWLCFHILLVGFTFAGAIALYLGSVHMRRLVGAGWQQTFAAAMARASDQTQRVEHDLTCVTCGYNLRTLPPDGTCPECGASVQSSFQSAVDRLTPDYAGMLVRARTRIIASVLAFAALATVLCLRAAAGDPQRPWWSASGLIVISALGMALAAWAPQRSFAWLGGLAACAASSIWYVTLHWANMSGEFPDDINLLHVNIVALAVAGLAWLVAEKKILSRYGGIAESSSNPRFWPAFHHACLALIVAALLALAGHVSIRAATGEPVTGIAVTTAAAWCAALGLLIAMHREPLGKLWPLAVYALGVAGLLQILAQRGLQPRTLTAAISISLAAYAFIALVIERLWTRFSPSQTASAETRSVFCAASQVLAIVSLSMALSTSLTDPDLAHRSAIVATPLLLTAAAWLIRAYLPRSAGETNVLALAGISAVLASWIATPPDMSAAALHRAVAVVAALTATFAAGVIAARWTSSESPWTTAWRRCLGAAGAFSAASLLYCVAHQINAIVNHLTIMTWAAVIAMIAALAVDTVACIAAAAVSRLDPLRLSTDKKGGYVYLAELLAALLCLHVRATMPWLFSGIIEQYWPALVLTIAFAGVTAGEILRRYGLPVLSQPLLRTGIILPLVASLELFIAASRIHYSAILLGVGAFYTVLAAMRRSEVLALLAAASFNGSLWYFLYQTPGLGLARHPQLWFIPPALAVLAAAHLNRNRLNAAQLRAVHYACLLAIYLSSTADVFLIGVARAPWLPLVLAGLSVAGVFVGFAFRLRSFLMLGTGFLCLSLLTMIWHAASNLGWTWVWYVAGIALGIAMITIFALFERKRAEMGAWVENLKRWAE